MRLYKKLASMLSLIMTTFFMGIFSIVITSIDEKMLSQNISSYS